MSDPHQDRTIVTLRAGGQSNRQVKEGDIIGESYRLKELIGQGGMGYVFRAEHIIMGKDYALKILAPDQINESNWKRFQLEGKAIAKLDHINIVKIYNMGADQGEYPFYAMDLLDGPTLADLIASGAIEQFSENEILDIFIQLATGFGYAHSRSIIHRDVKPGNVILVDGGGKIPTVKIVDFGIAKAIGAHDLHKQSQTATGEVFGSPYYMSPEQCMGTAIDQRSDIYSLGCTFFEVLCGRPPFVGENALATAMMHQNDTPPTLHDFTSKKWNDDLEALVARMLAKRPAERYQSMEQVRHDLERIKDKKALGRKTRTAIDADADADASHDDEKHLPPRKLILIFSLISALLVASWVAAYFVIQPFKPAAVNPLIPHDNLDSQKDIDAHAATTQATIASATRKLAAAGAITCSIDKKAGIKIFHCPDTAVGTLTWFAGQRDFGFDTDSHNDGRKVAKGDVSVPLNSDVILLVHHTENNDVWNYPDILKKFDQNALIGLRIDSDTGLDLYGSLKEQEEHAAQVTNLINATAGWKKVRYAYLYNCPVTPPAFDALKIHPGLDQLIMHTNEIDGEALSKEPYLKRLKVLDLMILAHADKVLSALKDARGMRMLTIKGHVTAAGLQYLTTCTALKYLEINDRSLTSDSLEVLTKLKGLHTIDLRHCKIGPEEIEIISRIKGAEIIRLCADKWSLLDRNRLTKCLPSARWSVTDPTTGRHVETQ